MNNTSTIPVYYFFQSKGLHSREQAQKLFAVIIKKMRSRKPIWIDFTDISFISRSFADELVNLKIKSKQRDLINFTCTSKEVSSMLEAVRKTQSKIKIENKPSVYQFHNLDSLKRYFANI